jgi:hypothetical protein
MLSKKLIVCTVAVFVIFQVFAVPSGETEDKEDECKNKNCTAKMNHTVCALDSNQKFMSFENDCKMEEHNCMNNGSE